MINDQCSIVSHFMPRDQAHAEKRQPLKRLRIPGPGKMDHFEEGRPPREEGAYIVVQLWGPNI
jgi:hypothetical protein